MKKVIFFIIILFNLNTFISLAGTPIVTSEDSENEYKKAYFAGGCFWCSNYFLVRSSIYSFSYSFRD